MIDFDYKRPSSVAEAVGLLERSGGNAKLLAGGTDVLVQLREGLRKADLVIDIKKIPDLMRIEHSADKGLVFGAGVPCHRLHGDPAIATAYPGLVDATRIIGAWQIQSRASVGGNLCNASPAADSIPILIAYAATCRIVGPKGERTVPVQDFCIGPGKNGLAPGEILVSIALPPASSRSGAHYQRFIPRNEMDIAVVGVGSWVQLDPDGKTIVQARIGLGAVAPTPLFAAEASQFLAGKLATAETVAEAARLAQKIARPISDMRGPAEYRTHLVGVLTRRTLAGAVTRARGGHLEPTPGHHVGNGHT